MAITIEFARGFIEDAKKGSRKAWLDMAERSWGEIKKRVRNFRLFSITPNALKRRSRYPVWYSIFKIRQGLVLSRVGIPIGRDTTQDGTDNVGATAAICLERLATNLAKNFDFFDVMSSARDDFLATCFGQVRAYYERDEVKERVKQYITPQKDPDTNDFIFVDAEGKEVRSDDILQDDSGYYIEHNEVIDVANERICLKPVLYRDFYVDPDIRRWDERQQVAFECHYSPSHFREVFGFDAYADLPRDSATADDSSDETSITRKTIKVFEFWDCQSGEVKWFAENGTDFITPKGYKPEDAYEGPEERKGLYDLRDFFPCPPPLVMNQATDEFWPIPEFYQLVEVIEDIHTIFSRMITATRAIRSRLLFDNNIEGLQPALNELSEADAIGITNLSQALTNAGGSLENVCQYIPVDKVINTLSQLYTALEQRLNIIYKLTGTSDLLQGLITDPTERTYGERQMLEKYARNQLEEPQRKMAEFMANSYELMAEMALKNFKEASLDEYIMPSTLDPVHQQNYRAAIALLKNNRRRFRIELETDSTIALNEQYDKQSRLELARGLGEGLLRVADISKSNPSLIIPELHALKYLIQGFRQGKLFQQEVTQAIDEAIRIAQTAPPPFDKEASDAKLEQNQFMLEVENSKNKAAIEAQKLATEQFKAQQVAEHDRAMFQLKAQVEMLQSQLAVLTYQLDARRAGVEIQNKLADNQRLESEVYLRAQELRMPKSPEVVVVPPAPQAPVIVSPQGPQIINAPNPPPQTSVIQPVQEIPVPTPIPGLL